MYEPEEIEKIRRSCTVVVNTFKELEKHIKPGITLVDLDKIAEKYILSQNARPAFLGYKGFPNATCLSLNEEVVHGIPDKRRLRRGDILSVDCGVELDGYFGDSAYTFIIGKISEIYLRLVNTTRQALYLGIAQAIPGNHIGDIGNAIEQFIYGHRFHVVRNLVGHGIGKHLHEAPEVPNFGKPGVGAELKPGMVIAIEPMVNLGTPLVKETKDGWTICTADRKPSAHFEHTVLITNNQPEILTEFIINN